MRDDIIPRTAPSITPRTNSFIGTVLPSMVRIILFSLFSFIYPSLSRAPPANRLHRKFTRAARYYTASEFKKNFGRRLSRFKMMKNPRKSAEICVPLSSKL